MSSQKNDEVIFEAKVSPRSSRSCIKEETSGGYKIYLHSPPVDGKANKECKAVLSKTFSVPKSSIEILRGQTSRFKTFKLSGISQKQLNSILKKISS